MEKRLTIFSEDPGLVEAGLLSGTRLHVLDMDGRTVATLRRAAVPHKRVRTLEALDAVTDGVLIVGEGMSWDDTPVLADSLLRLPQRGVSVLCLPPSNGQLPLKPPSRVGPARLMRVLLADSSIVAAYDKRFDSDHWLGGPSVTSNIRLYPHEGTVVARFNSANGGWPWLELDFADSRGCTKTAKFIVCGFGIVERWDAGPVPRFLFVRILEELLRTDPGIHHPDNNGED